LPSPVRRAANARVCARLVGVAAAILFGAVSFQGCQPGGKTEQILLEQSSYPPPPQVSQVLALGNLRVDGSPSKTEAQLAEFFFGAVPEPGLGLIKPVSVATMGAKLLICDSAMNAVLQWDSVAKSLDEYPSADRPQRPIVVRTAPNGDCLVIDIGRNVLLRFSPEGALVRQYAAPNKSFRAAGVVCVGKEVWISDAAGHCIAIFEADSGKYVRSIGGRGPGPAEFGAPLGMAATPDQHVCVVDTFNDRVQVLDATGKWVRDVGRPGNQVGCLGRPKDVAVGPDGVIFVTDASSQRVHAFDPKGRALLAFGEPESGVGSLAMPAGICVCEVCPLPDVLLPEGFKAAYYIAVAEQLSNPGIRVYAWRDRKTSTLVSGDAARPGKSADNPHWSADKCSACHQQEQGRSIPIAAAKTDAICLACHDGKKASEEAHPIGRSATAAGMKAPQGWPLVDGRIGCLTCHDVRRHCDATVSQPVINSAMVREFEPDRRMEFCNRCHVVEDFRRLNPHKQLDPKGAVIKQTCMVCHEHAAEVPMDGVRRNKAELRADNSGVCLACHAPHWDVSPRGHVDRPVTDEILRNIQSREQSESAGSLPIKDGKVTCYSCHNPHEPGLFPSGSPVGSMAASRTDAEVHLRVDFFDLCLHCHAK
jgi:hypothetical protein